MFAGERSAQVTIVLSRTVLLLLLDLPGQVRRVGVLTRPLSLVRLRQHRPSLPICSAAWEQAQTRPPRPPPPCTNLSQLIYMWSEVLARATARHMRICRSYSWPWSPSRSTRRTESGTLQRLGSGGLASGSLRWVCYARLIGGGCNSKSSACIASQQKSALGRAGRSGTVSMSCSVVASIAMVEEDLAMWT